MTRIRKGLITVLSAAAANGLGVAMDVEDYKAIIFQLATSGNAAATIKFAISMSATKPNFAIAPSITNQYDYVQLNWLNNDSSNPGANGIVVAGTDIVKIFEVNTNYIKWICPIISGYSAGAVTCVANAVNDYTR